MRHLIRIFVVAVFSIVATPSFANCVPTDLMAYVDSRIPTAATDRWVRIKNALTEQSNAMPLSEAKSILANRQAQNLGLEHMDEVVAAIECLAQPEPETVEADDVPVACVSPQLQADVKGYSEETWRESPDHVERWLRVLQTFSGTANDSTVMTPAEAQTYADRGLPRWVPVLAALQCLEAEALNAQVEVEDETTPEPQQDAGVPVDTNPDPAPDWPTAPDSTDGQDQSPSGPVHASFTAYFATSEYETEGPRDNSTCGKFPNHACPAWELDEDDHWEADIVLHYQVSYGGDETVPQIKPQRFCILKESFSDENHNSPGPVRLSGFTESVQHAPDSVCTEELRNSTSRPEVNPGWRNDSSTGVVDLSYETTIRIRDNNVVEAPYSVADLGFHMYGISTFSGRLRINGTVINGVSNTIATRPDLERPIMETTPDRAAYRLKRDVVAWPNNDPDLNRILLWNGSSWILYARNDATCGVVSNSKWTKRAQVLFNPRRNNQDLVRAGNEEEWLPDHCYPTKSEVKYPLEATDDTSPTIDSWELPTIVNDDLLQVVLKPHTRVGNDYTKVDLMVYRNHVGPFKIQYTVQNAQGAQGGAGVITHEHVGGHQRWAYPSGIGSRTTLYGNGAEARRDKVRTITVACTNGSGWLEARGAEGTQATTSRVQICYP